MHLFCGHTSYMFSKEMNVKQALRFRTKKNHVLGTATFETQVSLNIRF